MSESFIPSVEHGPPTFKQHVDAEIGKLAVGANTDIIGKEYPVAFNPQGEVTETHRYVGTYTPGVDKSPMNRHGVQEDQVSQGSRQADGRVPYGIRVEPTNS